jgi:hypothetical protein
VSLFCKGKAKCPIRILGARDAYFLTVVFPATLRVWHKIGSVFGASYDRNGLVKEKPGSKRATGLFFFAVGAFLHGGIC